MKLSLFGSKVAVRATMCGLALLLINGALVEGCTADDDSHYDPGPPADIVSSRI